MVVLLPKLIATVGTLIGAVVIAMCGGGGPSYPTMYEVLAKAHQLRRTQRLPLESCADYLDDHYATHYTHKGKNYEITWPVAFDFCQKARP